MKAKLENSIILIVILIMVLTINTSAELVALYTFDDGTANDSASAAGYQHGTLMNGASIIDDRGRKPNKSASKVLKINGPPQHVNCGGGKDASEPETWADLTNAITVAAWIKPDINVNTDTTYYWTVISKGHGEWGVGGFSLNRKKNLANMAFAVAAPGSLPYDGLEGTNPDVWDGKWHHVTGVYSTINSPDAKGVWKRGLYIYVDGIESGHIKRWGEPMMLNNYDVIIGSNAQRIEDGYRYWYGLIDDVAFFDNALNAKEINQLYTKGMESFFDSALQKLIDTIQEAEAIVRKQGHQEARAFLKKRIAKYEEWRKENPNDSKFTYNILSSDLYILLEKANIQNLGNVQKPHGNISEQAKSNGNWAAFKLFLDIVFGAAEEPIGLAKSLESNQDKKNILENYLKYCKGKSELIRYLVEKDSEIAEKYISKENFNKAVEIYRDIAKRYGPGQHRPVLEFKACECLFNGGEYQSAISELERFITRNNGTNESLAAKAILLKGQSYLQLNNIDKASEEFISLKTQYPKSKEIPATDFYIGYYHMLKNENKEAIEIFNRVVQEHPESPYANKARMCIMRIEGTTGD
ncbi:MAG: LamG-like jellyroll fold domain-containing protein [Planctomycetota bacterium]|jgi:hypothetical protein